MRELLVLCLRARGPQVPSGPHTVPSYRASKQASHVHLIPAWTMTRVSAEITDIAQAALEEHDADEERQSELIEENSEMEAALTSATWYEDGVDDSEDAACKNALFCPAPLLRRQLLFTSCGVFAPQSPNATALLCMIPGLKHSFPLLSKLRRAREGRDSQECDALRRELHDLTRILPVPSAGQAAGGNLDVNWINMSKRRIEEWVRGNYCLQGRCLEVGHCDVNFCQVIRI